MQLLVFCLNNPSLNPLVDVASTPAGFTFRFVGIPGFTYFLERSSDFTNWDPPIDSFIVPENGIKDYLDMNPPIGTGFYRARLME